MQVLAFGYVILSGANILSDGSELLLEILDPGLIGGECQKSVRQHMIGDALTMYQHLYHIAVSGFPAAAQNPAVRVRRKWVF